MVANPPYITEKDKAKKAYHREKVSGRRRYESAYREYSLGAPFTERCFQLANKECFVGLIVGNNFMKREFGKALIENVLADLDLTMVVDTSQAFIPHHGTPTVLIFGRNRSLQGDHVHCVMGRRGETGTPRDPAKGQVWQSIANGWNTVGFENEFVSVAQIARATFASHPWSLGGGGAAQLRETLENGRASLEDFVHSIGFAAISGEDNVFLQSSQVLRRHKVDHRLPLVSGEVIRDWGLEPELEMVWPNKPTGERLPESDISDVIQFSWPYRTNLRHRKVFGSPIEDRGLKWWEVREVYCDRLRVQYSLAFAFVATHNHFVFDRGGKVFKQSAPVIKLPEGATEDEHFALLGLLNSSTACFWMKQVFHCKGSQGINEGMKSAHWEQFYEFDATKIRKFPIPANHPEVLLYAQELDRCAERRVKRSLPGLLDAGAWNDAQSLRLSLGARQESDLDDLQRMVGLQEELDWLCYRLYGIVEDTTLLRPEEVEPISPPWLPYLLNLADQDAAVRSAVARGDDPGEIPSAWFERHRWQQLTELPEEASGRLRDLVSDRRARIREVQALRLIESSSYKRRWYRPDYESEEKDALALWLSESIESLSRHRSSPTTVDQMVSALQDESRVLAVAEVLAGRRDFNLTQLVGEQLQSGAVPSHQFHLYKPSGLDKRSVWEKTWDDQRREDAGENVTPAVPPKYTGTDFLKPEYFRLRGKLDVPKERFIAFTEVPGRPEDATLYGWAGWTPLERIRVLLALDEELEDAGVPIADRVGVLDSAWRLLPDAAREDAKAAGRLKAELQALVGPEGPSREMLEDWRERFPPPRSRGKGRKRK